MILRTGIFTFCAAFLLTQSALAAVPPKPAKQTKQVAGAKASPKPAAKTAAPKASPKPAAVPAQATYRLPTGGAPQKVPATPPPGVRTDPAPAAAAAAAPAKPAAQASAPAKAKPKKTAAKTPGKKKQLASLKSQKLKAGRAALSPMERIDRGQLATDHLTGAEKKSTLELLVSYKETVREGDLETAGVLLRLIANETPRHDMVTVVNDLLGLPVDTQDTEVLLEIARADRADAVAGDTAKKGESDKVPSPLGERIHAAHAAVEAAPRTSRLDALAAYKHAVLEGNATAAAVALSGVVQGRLDQETVNTANALLGVENIFPPGQLAAAN
ncbi:hypothetical protein IZ6_01790 [Terrihabitans soli]|uniref:Uncharacterized protein n=1 Tax=Terrihabitans soli TaxID=708113 RepID=A0A6S6QH31_9HYPH|nr:hypothetical protein [Terrihabitans soli]BCJ89444.1 hypothetical protein IZ6_01790 [Terrihabitans soli]